MAPDPAIILPGGDPPPDPPPPAPRADRSYIVCDCCGCQLVPKTGEILKMGARAKELRDADEEIARLKKDLATKTGELTTALDKLKALDAPAADKW